MVFALLSQAHFEFVDATRPIVHGDDRSFAHGVGVFESVGVFAARAPLLAPHLARLAAGAAALGFELPPLPGLGDVESMFAQLLDRAGHGEDGIVRMTVSAPVAGRPPAVVCVPRARVRGSGRWRVAVAGERGRGDPTAVFKTTSRAFWEFAAQRAARAGADDGLVVGIEDGVVLETGTGNVFALDEAGLRTPPLDGRILPGVGRAALLAAARADGLEVVEAPLTLDALRGTWWIVNAARGPRPAVLWPADSGAADAAPAPLADAVERLDAIWRRVVGAVGPAP
jgi:4-amino-4-deoxychorismate lyase